MLTLKSHEHLPNAAQDPRMHASPKKTLLGQQRQRLCMDPEAVEGPKEPKPQKDTERVLQPKYIYIYMYIYIYICRAQNAPTSRRVGARW